MITQIHGMMDFIGDKIMQNIIFKSFKQIKDNEQLSQKLVEELAKQPYVNGESIEVFDIDFKTHAELFLKLIVGTQLKYQLEYDVLANSEIIEMELPESLVPFMLDYNRHCPILKYEELFFNSYITKFLELVMVPVEEDSTCGKLVFDINP